MKDSLQVQVNSAWGEYMEAFEKFKAAACTAPIYLEHWDKVKKLLAEAEEKHKVFKTLYDMDGNAKS